MTGNTIQNGANRPINFGTGTVPDVSGALKDWFQQMVFTRVLKETVGFQLVEVPTPTNFWGFIQPLTERQLILKPEGQRAWTWFQIFAEPSLSLNVDEVVIWNGKQTRIMGRKDYAMFGYVEYSAVQDWTGSGP